MLHIRLKVFRIRPNMSQYVTLVTYTFCAIYGPTRVNPLSLADVGSNPTRIISCKEAIHLAYGPSAFRLRCSLVPEIMHGGVSEVKRKSHHITFTVLVQRKTLPTKHIQSRTKSFYNVLYIELP